MRQIILIFTIIASIIFTGCKQEEKFTVPALNGHRVVDTSNILSQNDIKELESAIKNFEQNTKGQFAVCIVTHMMGETVETASMKVAEAWKIGYKGKDNGILFFLSMIEREFRIEVGYGFEGKLNDAKCGDIGRIAIPYFKNNKWKDGINTIIVNCNNVIAGKKLQESKAEDNGLMPTLITVIIIIVLVIIIGPFDGALIGIALSGGSGRGSGGGFSGGGGGFGGGGFSGKF